MKQFSCLSIFLLFLVLANESLAQQNEPLEKEWLAKDVEALRLLPQLTPLENHTFESLQQVMGEPTYEENRGFGARTFTFSKGNGYTLLSVSAFTFNDAMIFYDIEVRGSSASWRRIRQFIIEAWKQNSNLEFTEFENGIRVERKFPEVLEAYKNTVSSQLGRMKPLSVPTDLTEAYEDLISPTLNSVVGSGGCSYGGVTPQGKRNIDAIVASKRIDLLENILKGYNAGGRVYAALALLEMEKRGLRLSEDAQNGIREIRNLDIVIITCYGCLYSYQTAKEILSKPEGF